MKYSACFYNGSKLALFWKI